MRPWRSPDVDVLHLSVIRQRAVRCAGRARPSLPSHWKVESPSLSFFNDIGIDGALAFLTKVLRNQERLRAS